MKHFIAPICLSICILLAYAMQPGNKEKPKTKVMEDTKTMNDMEIQHQFCLTLIDKHPDFAAKCIMAGNMCHKRFYLKKATGEYRMTFIVMHIERDNEEIDLKAHKSQFKTK